MDKSNVYDAFNNVKLPVFKCIFRDNEYFLSLTQLEEKRHTYFTLYKYIEEIFEPRWSVSIDDVTLLSLHGHFEFNKFMSLHECREKYRDDDANP